MHIAPVPTPEPHSTLGQRLREARLAAGLSQRETAIAVGVKYQAIQQWEYDATMVQSVHMPALEDALGLAPGTVGAWVRHSPLFIATLPPAPDTGAIPGQLRHLSIVSDLAA